MELEKLLLHDCALPPTGDNRMGIYQKDGMIYFAPALERDSKINNVRHWEQVFCVYVTNPHRSSEIWQYMYVINTAASTYHWNNMAKYDYTFRQLMSTYPKHSWAKTYMYKAGIWL